MFQMNHAVASIWINGEGGAEMNCKLEENSRLFDILKAIKKGYETGIFDALFPFLAQDCVMESQWVLTPNTGYDAVVDYLSGKGETLAKNQSFPVCRIVELIERIPTKKNVRINHNGDKQKTGSIRLNYTPGKLCLLMEQKLNEKINEVIVDITIENDGMVKRIDLCMPEFFSCREFNAYVSLLPTAEEWKKEDFDLNKAEGLIKVGYQYYDELELFLNKVGAMFFEYDDYCLPMKQWCAALEEWRSFISTNNYDEAFEKAAGVNYISGTVRDPDTAKELGIKGKRIWDDRINSRRMVLDLIEWTDLYKDRFSFIDTLGFKE